MEVLLPHPPISIIISLYLQFYMDTLSEYLITFQLLSALELVHGAVEAHDLADLHEGWLRHDRLERDEDVGPPRQQHHLLVGQHPRHHAGRHELGVQDGDHLALTRKNQVRYQVFNW